MILYVNPSEVSQVTPPEVSLRYARIPWDIITSTVLKRLDGYVYAVLAAGTRQGNYASIGTRSIADSLHTTQRRVVESLARLEKAGKIVVAPRKRGQRAGYVLTSPVFGQKQRAGVESLVSGPRPRLATVRIA